MLGATGALGQELVPLLTRAGATVLLSGRRRERLGAMVEASGAWAGVAGDLGSRAVRQRLYEAALAAGRLDAIACLIGEAQMGAFAGLSDAQALRLLRANLAIPMLAVKSLLPLMLRHKAGRICLVSSVWGYQPASGEVAYSAAKAGLIGFGRALAEELAPSQILVNVLAPAAFVSPMLAQFSAADLEALAARQGGHLLSARTVARRILHLLDPDLRISGRLVRVGRIGPTPEESPGPTP